jgi:hypothetical protein
MPLKYNKFGDGIEEYKLEAIADERDSALLHIVQLLKGRSPNDVAWWLCSNYPKFILDHPNLTTPDEMAALAIKAGIPPKGGTWALWFDRVRKLKPIDIIRR